MNQPSDFLSFVAHGLLPLVWWEYIVVTLVLTHITIASVTIFLHRHQAHRALDLHPAVSHFFRFWLWLTTGMVTKAWVAIHRKHHAKVETAEDPHSPQTRGIGTVFWKGTELYREEAKNRGTLECYGHGTPDDWIERNLYTRYVWQGVGLMLMVELTLFGVIGATMWAVQMLWIPIFAAGVINGIGHYWGYRNHACADASTNIVPWGIIIGGEELHNNHHAYASSAKLSSQWWEFDIGWLYIRLLEVSRLASKVKTPEKLTYIQGKLEPDRGTLEAILQHRFRVLRLFLKVRREILRAEIKRLREKYPHQRQWRYLKQALQETSLQTLRAREKEFRALWKSSSLSTEELLMRLKEWYQKATASGLAPLQEFAMRLVQCTLKRRV